MVSFNNIMTAITQDSKINSIQVLRGIASLIVAVYHLKYLTKEIPGLNQILNFFFDNGSAGVSLFFVISGFIMVYITDRKTFTAKKILQFIIKRFTRVWPTYILITFLSAFLIYRFQIGNQANQILRSIFFIPLADHTPPFYGYATLSVGWSLNYEIYFYILISISLFFNKYRWITFFVLITATLIVIPWYTGHLTLDPTKTFNYGNGYLNMISNPIIWNFVYGVIIGLLYTSPFFNQYLSRLFSLFTLVSVIVVVSIWQYLSGFLGGLGPFQWGIGSGLLFLAILFHTGKSTISFPKWLIHLGDISFSIYLLHLPVKLLIETIFYKIGYPAYSEGSAMFFLTISMTIIFSNLSYKYLEIRFSNYIKNLLLPR